MSSSSLQKVQQLLVVSLQFHGIPRSSMKVSSFPVSSGKFHEVFRYCREIPAISLLHGFCDIS